MARMSLSALLLSLAVATSLTPARAGSVPIAVSGFTRDMVVENTATDDPVLHYTGAVDATMDQGTRNLDNTWYEAGLAGGGAGGLPTSRTFTSLADPDTQFELASYTGPNALLLDSDSTTGTLTLPNPGKFVSLAFLVSSGLGGADAPVLGLTIHFADGGSTLTGLNIVAPDWFDNGPTALIASGRVGVDTGLFDQVGSSNPRMYQQTVFLPKAYQGREVARIDFLWSANGRETAHTGVFALSGAAVPEPASLGMLGVGILGLLIVRHRTAIRWSGSLG